MIQVDIDFLVQETLRENGSKCASLEDTSSGAGVIFTCEKRTLFTVLKCVESQEVKQDIEDLRSLYESRGMGEDSLSVYSFKTESIDHARDLVCFWDNKKFFHGDDDSLCGYGQSSESWWLGFCDEFISVSSRYRPNSVKSIFEIGQLDSLENIYDQLQGLLSPEGIRVSFKKDQLVISGFSNTSLYVRHITNILKEGTEVDFNQPGWSKISPQYIRYMNMIALRRRFYIKVSGVLADGERMSHGVLS